MPYFLIIVFFCPSSNPKFPFPLVRFFRFCTEMVLLYVILYWLSLDNCHSFSFFIRFDSSNPLYSQTFHILSALNSFPIKIFLCMWGSFVFIFSFNNNLVNIFIFIGHYIIRISFTVRFIVQICFTIFFNNGIKVFKINLFIYVL